MRAEAIPQPEYNPEQILTALNHLVQFEDIKALDDLLAGESRSAILHYLANMTVKSKLVLTLRVHEASVQKTLHKLAEYLPPEIRGGKFRRSLQPLMFSRMQRNANTLLYMGLPHSIVNKIFQYTSGDKDAVTAAEMLLAAHGSVGAVRVKSHVT